MRSVPGITLSILLVIGASCDRGGSSRAPGQSEPPGSTRPTGSLASPDPGAPGWPSAARKVSSVIRISGESQWKVDLDEGPVPIPARYTWAPASRYVSVILGTEVPYPVDDATEIRVQRHPLGWLVNERLHALDLRAANLEQPLPALEREAAGRARCLVWAGEPRALPKVSAIIQRLPHRCVAIWLREPADDGTVAKSNGDQDARWKAALIAIADRIVSLRTQSKELPVPVHHLKQLRLLHAGGCAVPREGEAPLLEQLRFARLDDRRQCVVSPEMVLLTRRPTLWRIAGLVSSGAANQRLLQQLRVEALDLETRRGSSPENDGGKPTERLPPLLLPAGLRELELEQELSESEPTDWSWLSGVPQLRILSHRLCPPGSVLAAVNALEVLRIPACPKPVAVPPLRAFFLDGGEERTLAPQLERLVAASPRLHELDIQSLDKLSEKQLAPLVRLAGSLQYLRLGGTTLQDGVSAVLARLSDLHELTIVVDLPILEFKPPWASLPKLRSLDLRTARLPAGSLQGLEKLTHLQELRIDGAKASQAELSGLSQLRQLRVLSLRGVELGDEQATHLGLLEELRWLDLSQTPVGERGLHWLRRLARLEYLDLSGTLTTDKSLSEVVEGLSHLVTLHLDGTDTGRQALLALSKLPTIRTLTLGHTNVHAYVLSGESLPRDLTILRLPYTHLQGGDLANLARLPRLHELDLRATGLVDGDAVRLPRLKHLRLLVLGQNNLSSQTTDRLRKLYPDAAISCLPCSTDRWYFEFSGSPVPTVPAMTAP